ncbi:hypothetical protein [Undibacterium oligocarboniphilum]|uniref:Type IV pilus biogenesis protein PilP n=1 Tax=Undibacterium oligocarboniphilum TaxID=666702 RepID=A0A850QQC9_9BURK|nr:hypothetical protein [Undibacterium oligocarboniphilum]MBC3871444.1 hypothetical protein [Undibacterium oligocarboniphilum]NVO78980.1 hypothetical protein [Undibacterium oligocarboniphilum]
MPFFKMIIASFMLVSTVSHAQQTLGDMLDLESKITVSKMKEELAKSSGEVKPTILPKLDAPVKPVHVEPRTVAIFGVSPDYEGIMDVNGSMVPAKKGSLIDGRLVTDISVSGITLTEIATPKRKSSKHSKPVKHSKTDSQVSQAKQPVSRFYPRLITQ